MSQELHYTSVPRGLKPGSRGFCTVGMTPHMPSPLVDRLEALSGYQPVFPPHDPSAALNPVVFSHLRLTISGKMVSVLSRIGPAGLDYSGRPNKYAHHVVMEGAERPEGGPAWLLSQPGFMQGAWEGEPREIPSGRTLPQGDRQPGVARAWQSLIGDGGWAGVLAESFLADPRRTVFLVFRPGMDLLPLFVEAMALLPASRRWEVDFTTYFNQLPQGVTCSWRGVLDGSDEARNAQRLPNAIFFDLCHLLGRAEGGALVHLARTGERIAQEPGTATAPPVSGRHIPRMPHEPAAPAAALPGQTGAPRPRSAGGSYELAPELARLVAGTRPPFGAGDGKGRLRKRQWVLAAALVVACLLPLVLSGSFLGLQGVKKLVGFNPEIAAARERVPDVKSAEAEADENKPRPEILPPKGDEDKRVSMKPAAREQQPPPAVPYLPRTPAIAPIAQKHAVTKRVDEEPKLLFFALPPISGLALGKTPTQPQSLLLQNRNDTIDLKTYYMNDFEVRFTSGNDHVDFWRKSSSNFGSFQVASLTRKDGKLHFEWAQEAMPNKNQAESLRDGILTIKSNNGDRYYVLLRGLRIAPKRLSLSPSSASKAKFVKGDLKPRQRELQWAEGDSLMGTSWPLGIAKWVVTSRRNEGPPMVMASGEESSLPVSVTRDIIPKEVSITLMVGTKNNQPGSINVLLKFDEEAVKRRWNSTERLSQLEKQKPRTREQDEEVRRLRQELGDPKHAEHITDIEHHLNDPYSAELSVIIGLRIDDSTVLKIAKFGDLAGSSN